MNNQGIQHRDGNRSIPLHEDFLQICDGNLYQSLILATLEVLVDRNDSEVSYTPINYKGFLFGRYTRQATGMALNQLLEKGFIERRQHTESYDYVYDYRISLPTVQEKIDQISPKVVKNKPTPSEFLLNMTGSQRVIWSLFGGLCAYCRINIATTWDHVIPTSKSGPNINANLVPACRECNMYKGNRDVLEWMEIRGLTPCDQLVEIIDNITQNNVDEVAD